MHVCKTPVSAEAMDRIIASQDGNTVFPAIRVHTTPDPDQAPPDRNDPIPQEVPQPDPPPIQDPIPHQEPVKTLCKAAFEW
jgi:hypothetical protein